MIVQFEQLFWYRSVFPKISKISLLKTNYISEYLHLTEKYKAHSSRWVKLLALKGEFANFLDWPIWCPKVNKNLIDRFLPEILTFKDCAKPVQHVSFDINISGMKLSPFSVKILSYFRAPDRPIKKWRTFPLT